jgi:hypothetical protein
METKYKDKVKKYSSDMASKEEMKGAFRPLSPKVQELISTGGDLDGKYIPAETAQSILQIQPTPASPEWGIRYTKKDHGTEKYIPNSPLKKELEVLGPKTPQATQYMESIKKRSEPEQRQKAIDMQEKIHYESLPDFPSIDESALRNPNVKQFVEEEYSRYKQLKSILEEGFEFIDPSTREQIKDEIRTLEGGLVTSGKFWKA